MQSAVTRVTTSWCVCYSSVMSTYTWLL